MEDLGSVLGDFQPWSDTESASRDASHCSMARLIGKKSTANTKVINHRTVTGLGHAGVLPSRAPMVSTLSRYNTIEHSFSLLAFFECEAHQT